MKVALVRLSDVALGVLAALFGLAAVVAAPFVVWFAAPIPPRALVDAYAYPPSRTQLPRWLWWFQTPDEPLPGAYYEPTVVGWLERYGPRVCSILWLMRNAGYGFAWWLGKPATRYLDAIDGQVTELDGLWRWKKVVGPVALQAGWKVHRADFYASAASGPYRAIPFVSIRLARNS